MCNADKVRVNRNPIKLEKIKQSRIFTGLFQSNQSINISTYIYISDSLPEVWFHDTAWFISVPRRLIVLSPDWLIPESAGRLRRRFVQSPTKSRVQHRLMTEALGRGFQDLEVLRGFHQLKWLFLTNYKAVPDCRITVIC